MKYKQAKISKENFINTPFKVDFRFYASKTGGLNIVPVDLAAKIMYHSCITNDNNDSYHLTNKEETPHPLYTSMMLEAINITGMKNVYSMPTNLNRFESFYYKAIDQLMPYITQEPISFDTRSSEAVCDKANISYPIIDKNNFLKLMNYAKMKQFGLINNNKIDHAPIKNKLDLSLDRIFIPNILPESTTSSSVRI